MIAISRVLLMLFLALALITAFQSAAYAVTAWSSVFLADEIMMAVALVGICVRVIQRHHVPTYLVTLCAVALLLITCSLVFGVQPRVTYVLGQVIVSLKMFVFAGALFWAFPRALTETYVQRVMAVILTIALFSYLADALYPELFTGVLGGLDLERGDGRRIRGLFLNSNYLALTLALAASAFAFCRGWSIRSQVLVVFAAAVLIYFTGSRTGLGLAVIAAACLALYLTLKSRNVISGIAVGLLVSIAGGVVLLGALLLFIEKGIVELTMEDAGALADARNSQYIRAVVIVYGYDLMVQYFPFGSGAATFASVFSADSPIYSGMNASAAHFFYDMWPGVFDSNIGTIMGEYGVIGLCAFALLVLMLRRAAIKRGGNSRGHRYFTEFLVIGLLLSAFTAPVFSHGYLAFLFASSFLVSAGNAGQRRVVCRGENRNT